MLAVGNDRQFASLCSVLGLDELASDERYATNAARVANRDVLVKTINEALSSETADTWFDALTAERVPAARSTTLPTRSAWPNGSVLHLLWRSTTNDTSDPCD